MCIPPRLLKGRADSKPRISEKNTPLRVLVVGARKGRKNPQLRSSSPLRRNRSCPSSESSHQAEHLQMSQLAKRRNRPSHSSFRVLFYIFIFSTTNWAKTCCLEKDVMGGIRGGQGKYCFTLTKACL